jgi:hypothetical protein
MICIRSVNSRSKRFSARCSNYRPVAPVPIAAHAAGATIPRSKRLPVRVFIHGQTISRSRARSMSVGHAKSYIVAMAPMSPTWL